MLFRGVKLSQTEVESYKVGTKINLIGYTSTSKRCGRALNFAFKELKQHQVPVLFEISFKSQSGLFELTEGYTAYPEEEEILVQDGLQYLITANDKKMIEDTKEPFQVIKL